MRLSEATKILKEAGVDNARHDARAIFEHFDKTLSSRLCFEDTETENESVLLAIARRAKREPLQYILGEVGFFRESYEVTPDVLIPRSDTEILVDFAVRNIPEGEHFIDLCTGSGCIAVSVLKNTKDTTAEAVDISAPALLVAKRNAAKNGVSERLSLTRLDVLSERATGEFFAVISNPPYVTKEAYEALEPELYSEPKIALVAEDDGLCFYKKITSEYKNSIKEGGFILFEIGYDQGEKIKKIAESEGMRAEVIKDLSGNDRVAVLRKEPPSR